MCVVPRNQRRVKLSHDGCRTCGCKGCTVEDRDFVDNKSRDRGSERLRQAESLSSSPSLSAEEQSEENFGNFSKSSTLISSRGDHDPLLEGVPPAVRNGRSRAHRELHSGQKPTVTYNLMSGST